MRVGPQFVKRENKHWSLQSSLPLLPLQASIKPVLYDHGQLVLPAQLLQTHISATMSSLTAYLPPFEGLLPKWLLFVRESQIPSALNTKNLTLPLGLRYRSRQ